MRLTHDWDAVLRMHEGMELALTRWHEVPDDAITHDGPCPGRLLAAVGAVSAAAGYEVIVDDAMISLGTTGGPLGDPPMTIKLSGALEGAALFRVLCHETSHIVLGHPPQSEEEAIAVLVNRAMLGTLDEDPAEEVSAELAAAGVTHAAGVGTGQFSAGYIRQRVGHFNPLASLEAGMLAARALWAAIEKGER